VQSLTYELGWIAAHSPAQLNTDVDSPTADSIDALEHSICWIEVLEMGLDVLVNSSELPHDTRINERKRMLKR